MYGGKRRTKRLPVHTDNTKSCTVADCHPCHCAAMHQTIHCIYWVVSYPTEPALSVNNGVLTPTRGIKILQVQGWKNLELSRVNFN